MTATVKETIAALQNRLREYIEATYHIADPRVVEQRRRLLEEEGGTFKSPYIESTPRYKTGLRYEEMTNIPAGAKEAYCRLSDPANGKPLLYNPPYVHQAESIDAVLAAKKNLMIMTGTGSGKTESFLLPILGKFATEAKDKPEQFSKFRAIRAMVLYPMNALVNDQLGRLRALFGDRRVVAMFQEWADRPATFARYTSRTPYAGVRTTPRDQRRLKSFKDFFVEIEQAADRSLAGAQLTNEDDRAAELKRRLVSKGKWPAKPSLTQWYGNGLWEDDDGPRRAVTLPHDSELLTRHEVQSAAADLLITNYSMLEYMMLRPIERPIFEQTKEWLHQCKDEKFLIVLDEAHLYRGAQGAEVGLLLRRLRERLDISEERFQVICATASFSEEGKANAGSFGAQLSGVNASTFIPIRGDYELRAGEATGSTVDIEKLVGIDIDKFFAEEEAERRESVESFLTWRSQGQSIDETGDLYKALEGYGPFSRLVNETMKAARSLDELREIVFPGAEKGAGDRAINALLAMGSRARPSPDEASLLPCRIHTFFRGLPGLWACMDPNCSQLSPELRGGPIGKLYSQPVERCDCNAKVLPYYTCRYCGASYARAYTRDPADPVLLFSEPGKQLVTFAGQIDAFQPIDLLLEQPTNTGAGVPWFYDLISGRLDDGGNGARTRPVYLRAETGSVAAEVEEEEEGGEEAVAMGQFRPCGCCGRSARRESSVQDHVTKGDQPFHALVAEQIKVQPPSPVRATEFAPLRGRKVLVFSDSRQVAARLAPALQGYSLKDTLRALLPLGYQLLKEDRVFGQSLVLERAWIATVIAAHKVGVRLRPELDGGETMPRPQDAPPETIPSTSDIEGLLNQSPPANLLRAIVDVLRDNLLGLEALAIASIREATAETKRVTELAPLAGVAETDEEKLAVARAWLRLWVKRAGVWFRDMPDHWWTTGEMVKSHSGIFDHMKYILPAAKQKKAFREHWLPNLLSIFTDRLNDLNRLAARKLTLDIGGAWVRCDRCTSVHRKVGRVNVCIDCGFENVKQFDPDADPVYQARRRFYRNPVISALESEKPVLMSIIAAEHTAQLNAARPDTAFSHAEYHELQFQDVDLAWRRRDRDKSTSIDVLSSTTTMEVGIDIGDLSGVALRNMPPGRANYQQRAGRAGRRANAIATVVAFGSADSHDDHYFSSPEEMIRGQVVDPRLTLENPDIARRHIRAFLLQRYHEARLPRVDQAEPGMADLFSVLGNVRDFAGDLGLLGRADLQQWLLDNHGNLRRSIDGWLPVELSEGDRKQLLESFIPDLLRAVDIALNGRVDEPTQADDDRRDPDASRESEGDVDEPIPAEPNQEEGQIAPDEQPREDELAEIVEQRADVIADKLLDRLLYWGVLPRYAFPTDVAPFYVFSGSSTEFRPVMEYAPTQGLNIALSQYAPNKQIWIKGKQYTSKAIYSPFRNARPDAWAKRRLYYECSVCGHARTDENFDPDRIGETLACEACHTPGSFGPAKSWFRPPGFAHLWGTAAPSVPDEPNETAYATRAKLIMTGDGQALGDLVTDRVRGLATRQHLLVSNSGPNGEGYDYCVACGRIESRVAPETFLWQEHARPYPTEDNRPCEGFVRRSIVLGTDFPTDIALFQLRFDPPFHVPPATSATASAMRTVCEALSKAACRMLEIEAGEIMAEYRPALSSSGASGSLVEVFLYDTLAGGAGFSSQMAARGKELFEVALKLLETCPNQCGSSCYRCLRNFRNKLDHALLDRHVGAQLLRHLLTGEVAPLDRKRAMKSLGVVADDLQRKLGSDFEVILAAEAESMNAPLVVRRLANGDETLIDIQSPVAPGHAVFKTDGEGVIILDDLLIRCHLGEEVEKIINSL